MRKAGFVEPMHAKLVDRLPDGDEWLYEVKLDGYRAQAVKDGDSVRLLSRRNNDLTAGYPAVRSAVSRIRAQRTVLDGEIVAADERGRPSFQALQYRTAHQGDIAYYAFDLLHLNGADMMGRPLDERKALLRDVVAGSGVLLSDGLPGDADAVTEAIRRLGLEGVVAKRRASLYEAGRRSGAWVKLKLDKQQEFVVGGYRPGYGTLDTLLVGYFVSSNGPPTVTSATRPSSPFATTRIQRTSGRSSYGRACALRAVSPGPLQRSRVAANVGQSIDDVVYSPLHYL